MRAFAIFLGLAVVVSVVWLAIARDWGSLGWGFLAGVLGPLILAIPLMLVVPIAAGMAAAHQRGNIRLALALGGVSLFVTYVVTGGYALGVFYWLLHRAKPHTIYPLLFWGYSVAVAPMEYIAKKEGHDAEGAWFTTFIIQVALLVQIATLIIFGGKAAFVALGLYGAVLLLGYVWQMSIAHRATAQVLKDAA